MRKPYSIVSPNGTRIDNYYWLRDDTRTSKAVLDYLRAENAWRDTVMAHTAELKETLYQELISRIDPNDQSVPVLDHGYWYYTHYNSGQEYPVYARRKGSMDAPEQLLLDGNAWAQGHDYFRIGTTAVSPDGRMLAWTEDTVGRRQYTLRIRDLETGVTLTDSVSNIEEELVWAGDSRTVLYVAKDPVTLLSKKVYRHTIGENAGADAEPDRLVYEEPDDSYYVSISHSRSEQYLFIELSSTDQTETLFAAAGDPELHFRPVLPREAGHEYSVDQLGDDFVIRTNWQAPNFRIVRAPIATSTDKRTWRDVVPHRSNAYIEGFEVAATHLAVNERIGGLLRIRVLPWPNAGVPVNQLPDQPAPGQLIAGSEPAFTMTLIPTPDINSPSIRYSYSSLITPDTVYDHDLRQNRSELQKVDRVPGFQHANYATAFVMAPARDGKQIPVSLAWRKGTPRDGTAPLYQYGYGSYGLSTDPDFVRDWVSLMDRGFVVAIAHVRGGQELGRQWYEDGRLLHKKNTFNDFIDVTRYLVQERYAARDKVFAHGGSAGGLLMGAIANMAPDEYRGIIADVPFVDVVTTMLDETIPLTTNEFDQWGNPKEKVYYDYMLSYSPYDNVKAQNYPAMLVETGLWDSQVQYFEPAKWVAKLRATKTDHHPLIFSVDMIAGHGGQAGRYQRNRETALEYTFILDQLQP
ncbi:MAG: S9 family peptidase [Gammaproteobacteria bacterium]